MSGIGRAASKILKTVTKRRPGYFATLVILLATPSGTAQTTTAAETIVIRAGRLFDAASGRMIERPVVVVKGDRVESVDGGTANPPADARVIDLGDATLLPGFIDVHTHLTINATGGGYESLGISVPRQALIGAKNARVTLQAGFTTVRNVGASGYSDVALRDAINAGDVAGPRMLVSGPALGITGGHCDENLLPFEFHYQAEGVADGIEAVQHKVREVIKYGADLIKICATGGVMSKGDDPNASQYTQEEMKAIVAEAHRLGRKVAAHAHGAEGVRWASIAGVDSVEHGHLMDDDSIATLKKNGTYIVPTLYLMDWNRENLSQRNAPDYMVKKMQLVSAAGQNNLKRAFAAGL